MQVSPKDAGMNAERLEVITTHLQENYIESAKIAGCQVYVSRNGVPCYHRSLGAMNIEDSLAMRDDTIFRIHSMTKPIVSVALMQLYEQGHFQLSDRLSRFLPEFSEMHVLTGGSAENPETEPANRPLTLEDVITHQAGLSYGDEIHAVDDVYRHHEMQNHQHQTLAEFVVALAAMPLAFQPGSRWRYSYATDVCGRLVEVMSGLPLDQYLELNVFEPLGMVDTKFHVAAASEDRLASMYYRDQNKRLQIYPENRNHTERPVYLSGGGGLYSTLTDYVRFCEMLRGGGNLEGCRILGPRTLEFMTRNHLPNDEDLPDRAVGDFSADVHKGIGFGLGFGVYLSDHRAKTLSRGDYFWGGAASTVFWVDPVESIVVVFMTQLIPMGTFDFQAQLKNIIYSAIEI